MGETCLRDVGEVGLDEARKALVHITTNVFGTRRVSSRPNYHLGLVRVRTHTVIVDSATGFAGLEQKHICDRVNCAVKTSMPERIYGVEGW